MAAGLALTGTPMATSADALSLPSPDGSGSWDSSLITSVGSDELAPLLIVAGASQPRSFSLTSVPEPASISWLGLCVALAHALSRRRRGRCGE